jgi:hypothetical protein
MTAALDTIVAPFVAGIVNPVVVVQIPRRLLGMSATLVGPLSIGGSDRLRWSGALCRE